MYKPRWSAFYRTGLDDFLDARAVDTVVVCGCNFPNCPRATLYEASERDYRLVFVSDATSGVYERGLQELENIGVAVTETGETIDWMTGATTIE
jgi:nicotinamidase-related amidase